VPDPVGLQEHWLLLLDGHESSSSEEEDAAICRAA
jgi:hypothetical protein